MRKGGAKKMRAMAAAPAAAKAGGGKKKGKKAGKNAAAKKAKKPAAKKAAAKRPAKKAAAKRPAKAAAKRGKKAAAKTAAPKRGGGGKKPAAKKAAAKPAAKAAAKSAAKKPAKRRPAARKPGPTPAPAPAATRSATASRHPVLHVPAPRGKRVARRRVASGGLRLAVHAELSPHLRLELARRAGLVYHRVAAGLDRLLARAGERMRGERDDRDVPRRLVGLEPSARLPAVELRQRQVHADHVRVKRAGLVERVDAVLGGGD